MINQSQSHDHMSQGKSIEDSEKIISYIHFSSDIIAKTIHQAISIVSIKAESSQNELLTYL